MRAPASAWAQVAAAALLAARATGQALTVQSAVGPNAPSLGWSNSANNAEGPHFMRLSPDGGTLYTVLYDYGRHITPALPSSQFGPQIVAIPVSGPGAVSSGGGAPPWSNVAGGNPTHACNDGVIDGLGSAAQFGRMAICADPGFNNFYVADYDNHGIRKVSLAPGASTYGLTTTIAGFRYYSATQCTANSVSYPGWSSGQQGYSSGDATSSFFLFPRACSVQPEAPSQLFIADGGGGQRIRVLDLDTMIVSIVAGGGPAYTAANNYPTPVSGFADGQGINGALFKNIFDITFEPTTPGWLYVADRFAVRKVDVRSVGGTYGYVTTLAGGANANSGANGQGSAASFSLLRGGLQPDGFGNLIAGESQPCYMKADGSLCSYTSGQYWDAPCNTCSSGSFSSPDLGAGVRSIDVATGTVTRTAGQAYPTVGGFQDGATTSALFRLLQGIAIDARGGIFVGDAGNSALRYITPPSPSLTPSSSSAPTKTSSVTASPTVTPSTAASVSVTQSVAASVSVTASVEASSSVSPSVSPSTTLTSSETPSTTTTGSITASASATSTETPSTSLTGSATPSTSLTGSVTPSVTLTSSATPSTSATLSVSPSTSVTPSVTLSTSTTASTTASSSVTVTGTSSATLSQTLTGSETPSTSVTASSTLSTSETATLTLSTSVTASVTLSSTVTSSVTLSLTLTATVTLSTSVTASATVSPSETTSVTVSSSPTLTATLSTSVTASVTTTATVTLSGSTSVSVTVSASVSPSVTPSTSPAPSGAASFVLQASLYYPTEPARDPAAYTPTVLTVALTALKCDFATISGVKAGEISYSSATPAVNATAAPGLLAAVATAAANASAADALDCYNLALHGPPPAALIDAGSAPAPARRRALQASGPAVTAAKPLVSLALVFVITSDAPVVGTVPIGTSVMPKVLAALSAAANKPALFTTVNSLWSAANGVSAWYSNATFFTSATPTVYGDTPGTQVDIGLSPAQQLGLALGLAIPLGIAAIVIVAITAGGASCCCCACACCRACRRRCGRGELKPLDPEIAHDRAANDLQDSRDAVLGEMMDGYAAEAAATK